MARTSAPVFASSIATLLPNFPSPITANELSIQSSFLRTFSEYKRFASGARRHKFFVTQKAV